MRLKLEYIERINSVNPQAGGMAGVAKKLLADEKCNVKEIIIKKCWEERGLPVRTAKEFVGGKIGEYAPLLNNDPYLIAAMIKKEMRPYYWISGEGVKRYMGEMGMYKAQKRGGARNIGRITSAERAAIRKAKRERLKDYEFAMPAEAFVGLRHSSA